MPPERLHELLASALVVGIVPCALLAWRYLQVLDRFFQELRDKEPALARQIGSPGGGICCCCRFGGSASIRPFCRT